MNAQAGQAMPSDLDLTAELEERADYIPAETLIKETAITDFYARIQKKLVQTGTKLLMGPRGCGKTHIMRFTYLTCRDQPQQPFAIYATFNRYYRLEPLLQRNSSAIAIFHTWALAVILSGLAQSVDDFMGSTNQEAEEFLGLPTAAITGIIGKLERNQQLNKEETFYAEKITIASVQAAITRCARKAGRKRTILLLDDAALTLTREYLHEFFDIVRAIKTAEISPKASVYPGTTEYGPNFHVNQEAEAVSVWLSPEDPSYAPTMLEIARLRVPDFDKLSSDVASYLMYAAFGVPRAYLVLLRGFQQKPPAAHTQATINGLIQDHSKARIDEYLSLTLKMPKLASIIQVGADIFDKLVEDLRAANSASAATNNQQKQLVVGISGTENNSLIERMLSLLLEAGLLHELQSVSHGKSRTYRRFLVNLAILLDRRAFSDHSRGTSLKSIVEVIERAKSAKHPLRRSIQSIISKEQQQNLHIDLPACTTCGTSRLAPTQKFCHHCGSQLVDQSAFDQCTMIKLTDVPGLTEWQRGRIGEMGNIQTIGEFLAEKDPVHHLRKIHLIGEKRAAKIIRLVTVYIDEFLS